MDSELEQILINSHKDEMIIFLNSHPELFEEAIELATCDREKLCWRAAFLLWGCMKENDLRIKKHINKILGVIPEKKDGHQRELVKILSRMKLNEEQEGRLFNICMKIWEQINKTPSLRVNAFKFILQMIKKYPELSGEISYITQSHYLETLSPGVKHSISLMLQDLDTDSLDR